LFRNLPACRNLAEQPAVANDDLFDEEEGMVRMTFGEHLEDLRRRLILALFGFVPGVIIGLCVGHAIVQTMKDPAETALLNFYKEKNAREAKALEKAREQGVRIETKPLLLEIDGEEFRKAIDQAKPGIGQSNNELDSDQTSQPPSPQIKLKVQVTGQELQIALERTLARMRILTLNAQESFMAYMMVSIVAGLVLSSWWVIYQLWQFVAEGLYKHERRVVYKAMPLSIGLFFVGVAFCFYIVLPVVLKFFFSFNEWFDIEPNLRLSEWLSFATMLPVIFGICFELPLVMSVLERVGIFRLEDYTNRWRHAILIISIIAMVVTPTTDPGSMMLLMGPLTGLYFLGIGMVYLRAAKDGRVPPLTAQAKVRIIAWTVAGLYASVVGSFFVLYHWLPDNWFETVWKRATLPSSYIAELVHTITLDDTWWIWGVTLGNAFLLGVLILRLGEFAIWIAGRRRTK
jgi:sec-independent protein translocase protein TatC